MMKITIIDGGDRMVFELERKLTGPWVVEMKKCWQGAGEEMYRLRGDRRGGVA